LRPIGRVNGIVRYRTWRQAATPSAGASGEIHRGSVLNRMVPIARLRRRRLV